MNYKHLEVNRRKQMNHRKQINHKKTDESLKTNKSQKTNKLQAFNKELHRKMINTMKKVLMEFVDKRHKIVFFGKDDIILKQTQVKKHNKDITENVSKIKIRRNIITLKLVQLTNVYCECKHIEEKN